MPALALLGGKKVRDTLLPSQNTIGEEEIAAANRVLRGGLLTGYQANAERMMGGPEVQALEAEWEAAYGAQGRKLHCVAVNSCTSGLVVACGAVGIKPGDEVIVTPFSMTCSATAPMAWGGVPVFADVDPMSFNLDPEDVERKITPRTKAIIVVDLFGLPYDKRIDEVAERHGLKVIEDAAQAVGATRGPIGEQQYAGTLGHIGVHSFNLGKHLTCGEGGLICTYDEDLAMRCRLLMNHAEAVVNSLQDARDQAGVPFVISVPGRSNLFGFNLRMTEVSAAIVRVQLSRREWLIGQRVKNAHELKIMLNKIPEIHPGFYTPKMGITHTHYVIPLLFNISKHWGVHRDIVVEAVRAELMPCAGREWEGVPVGGGYIKPIWRMPLFQSKSCVHEYYGEYPMMGDEPLRTRTIYPYRKVKTPVCDRLWQEDLIIIHRLFGPNADEQNLRDVADAFCKVWENREELRA